ncbi:MAG: sigma-70 family RNA polymerase sigma factor [Isosphaeraceae bacterium]
MAGIRMDPALGLIGALFRDGSATGMSDEQLLERFVSQRGAAAEHAFEALVQRHGRMVMGVCRSVVLDLHDAEDAFQATFLILARKASSLREPALLGPWLHGVARRTAQKAKARRARLEGIIRRAGCLTELESEARPDQGMSRDEEAELLHGEISRLPERYRRPVVLCYLEGLTHEEAARQLGWPMGTLGVRLMRARERLRARLTRRGMAPTGLAALQFGPPAEPLASSLVEQTARTALSFASGTAPLSGAIPAHVIAIATGVLRTMSMHRIATRIAAVLACGLVAAGSAALALSAQSKRPNAGTPSPAAQKASPAKVETKSILANGGFERGTTGSRSPESWKIGANLPGVEYLWDRTVAHSGRASLHMKKRAQRYFPIAQWFQEVKRTGNVPRLKVGAFIKAQKTTKAILDVQFVDKDGGTTHEWAAYIGAKQASDPPVTHAWKWYERVVNIPDGTQKLLIAAQIYGPGDVWFDDVVAEYTDANATDATDSTPSSTAREAPAADVADVPAEERKAGQDPHKRYFLIGPIAGSTAPAEGYRLLILLPGGAGGADFHPFAKRIAKNGLPPGYLVAQLVAFAWAPGQFEQVVWPTATDHLPAVGFLTEEFVEAVIADVTRTNKVDPRFIFTLGWSSGGPPAYATSLRSGTRVTGSFVAMSVFKPQEYPALKNARGHRYYILHSPQDFIPINMAEAAKDELRRNGANAELRTYEGGHGWHGDVYGEIRRGVAWLEANQGAAQE